MADGEITVKLDEEATRRLQRAADAAGRPVAEYAAELIAEFLAPDKVWAEDERIVDEYDRTGVSYSVEEGLAAFDAAVERRLKSRA